MYRQEYWNGYPLYDDATPAHVYAAGGVCGTVERDYAVQPDTVGSSPSEMDLIPPSDYDAIIDRQEAEQSSLEHLYLRAGWEHLDQGPVGYCWAHSVTHALMLEMTKAGVFEPLSAYAVAATIKSGRDEGGWCGLSIQFAKERGVPTQRAWPQGDRDYRRYDTPAVWADAARHRVTEDWVDYARPAYDRTMVMGQHDSCLLNNVPLAVDYMWWAHSVCALRLVRIEPGSYGTLILNSWAGWGRRGLGVIRGDRRRPDGCVGVRASRAAPPVLAA